MVSIIPAERTSWDVIGEKIGANLSQNLPRTMENAQNRQRGLNAIDQLQEDIKNANGDIAKMIPAVAKAYTLNPELQRSGIAEKLIPLAQRYQASNEFPVGGKSGGGMPTKQGEQPGQDVPVSINDFVQPRPSMIQDPTGLSNFQYPYGEEEFEKVRQGSRQKGYSPEVEERLVNDLKELNEVAQQKRNAEISNYDQAQKQRRDTLENQELFTKYLQENAPEFAANPDEQELALKASEKYQGEKSFANRLAKVKEELRPYQAAVKALDIGLQRPLTGYTPQQLELMQNRAQYMVQMGQKPKLQLMIAKNGHGQVEEAMLLNPLPKDFQAGISRFNNFIHPNEMVTNKDPESPEYQKQLDRGIKKLENQKEQMTDYLSRNIVPGTYNKPGTNLLLVRNDLVSKKIPWDQAGSIIDNAIKKGEIKLDPQQQIDIQKLGYPALTGETYMDTIMNNLMFPVTGKQ